MHPLFSARVPLVRRYAHIHVCLCDHAIREARLPLSACTCSSCSSAHSCTTRLRSSKFPVPPPRSRSTHPQRRTAAPKMERSAGPATPATTPVTRTLHAKVCAACLCIALISRQCRKYRNSLNKQRSEREEPLERGSSRRVRDKQADDSVQYYISMTEDAHMQADDYIRLHSLHSAKEHNGKTGRLVAFDPDAGRWQVALADGGRLNVKPANLELVGAEKAPTRTQICFGSGASSAEAPLVDEAPPPWYDEHLDDEFVDSGIFDETFCYILKQMDLDVCHPDSPIAQLFGDGLATSMMHVAAVGGDIPLLRALLRRGAVSCEAAT